MKRCFSDSENHKNLWKFQDENYYHYYWTLRRPRHKSFNSNIRNYSFTNWNAEFKSNSIATSFLFVVKFVMCVWKDENKKRGRGWLILKKHHQRHFSIQFQEIYKDRKKFSKQVFEVASSDLVNMGITVVSYTLKDIRDEEVIVRNVSYRLNWCYTRF